MKIIIYVDFVTSVFSFILNIVSTNLQSINQNKQMETDTFDLQDIKSGTVFLSIDMFYSLILAADIVIYLSFISMNGNLFKQVAVTAKPLQ